MEDHELLNKIVFLTVHTDRWLRDGNPRFNIPMANRLARVVKVFDWETEEGRLLLEARRRSEKWGSMDPRDFKFVLSIYYPELVKDGKRGMTVEEVMPRKYPGTDLDLFTSMPAWVLEDVVKERKGDLFKLALPKKSRAGADGKRPARKRPSKKKTAKKKTAKKKAAKGKPRVSRRSGK